jgi:hypothetical protein
MSVCATSTKSLPSDTFLLLIEFLQVSCPSYIVSSSSRMLCSATTRNVGVQKHVFDKSMSSGMTRVAGASLAAASSYAMLAGFSGSGTDRRRACRVVAIHSAVGAGACATDLLATSHHLPHSPLSFRTCGVYRWCFVFTSTNRTSPGAMREGFLANYHPCLYFMLKYPHDAMLQGTHMCCNMDAVFQEWGLHS